MTPAISPLLHGGAAGLCAIAGVLVLSIGRGLVGWSLAFACLASAAWAGAVALAPGAALAGPAASLEILRSGSWFLALLVLYHWLAGALAARVVLRFAVAGAGLLLTMAVALLPGAPVPSLPGLGSAALLAQLGFDLLIIVLAENLYRNADEGGRWHVNLPCIAFGCLAGFDLVVFADAALSHAFSAALLDTRAVMLGLAAPLMAVAAVRERRTRRGAHMPRRVMFHGATLIIAGTFLLGVGAAGEAMRHIDIDLGGTVHASLLAGTLMALAVVAASRSARSRVRNLIVEQFFTGRYDYRKEWLRCITTLSAPEEGERDPHARAIRAIADAADSPGGVLLIREEMAAGAASGRLRWAASWNVPAPPAAAELEAAEALLDAGGRIARLDGGATPAPLAAAFGPLWLAVPLVHHRDGPTGLVLLAAPRAPFAPDREADELLRTLGRAVAMFLSERRAAERLAKQRRLQDYAKRFAFVAHDVKTVSSQLEMLLANAEENLADPDFQADMLLTVRASAKRIKALVVRLGQPGEEPRVPAVTPVLAGLRAVAAAGVHPIRIEALAEAEAVLAAITPEAFSAIATHVINNAADASRAGEPVRIRLRAEGGRVVVDIIDRGPGMSPEFIRDKLFSAFETSKPEGSGIGAWQARELARGAGGELTVLSELGIGTTMRLVLPAAAPGALPQAAGARHEGGA